MKRVKVVNLTECPIRFVGLNGGIVTIPPEKDTKQYIEIKKYGPGELAPAKYSICVGYINGIPVVRRPELRIKCHIPICMDEVPDVFYCHLYGFPQELSSLYNNVFEVHNTSLLGGNVVLDPITNERVHLFAHIRVRVRNPRIVDVQPAPWLDDALKRSLKTNGLVNDGIKIRHLSKDPAMFIRFANVDSHTATPIVVPPGSPEEQVMLPPEKATHTDTYVQVEDEYGSVTIPYRVDHIGNYDCSKLPPMQEGIVYLASGSHVGYVSRPDVFNYYLTGCPNNLCKVATEIHPHLAR